MNCSLLLLPPRFPNDTYMPSDNHQLRDILRFRSSWTSKVQDFRRAEDSQKLNRFSFSVNFNRCNASSDLRGCSPEKLTLKFENSPTRLVVFYDFKRKLEEKIWLASISCSEDQTSKLLIFSLSSFSVCFDRIWDKIWIFQARFIAKSAFRAFFYYDFLKSSGRENYWNRKLVFNNF